MGFFVWLAWFFVSLGKKGLFFSLSFFPGLGEAAAKIFQWLFKANWAAWVWSKVKDWWERQGAEVFTVSF